MASIIKNGFPESILGPKFASDQLKTFKEHIAASLSFVVISMPGVGVSHFLKYLACQDLALFCYVDAYSLPHLTKYDLYKRLLSQLGGKPGSKQEDQLFHQSRAILKALTKKHDKIVIIFSRFDQLRKEFDHEFLGNLRSLVRIARGKIVLILTATNPLNEISPEAIAGGNLGFYSENLYFKPYSKEDLKKLLPLTSYKPTDKATIDEMINLSGGHNQLLHILLNSQKENLMHDQFVKMQMRDLIANLDYAQRKQLQKIALGKKIPGVDESLSGIGIVRKTDSGFELFTPLLKDYIKRNLPVKLPVKENKLFKLLRKNSGRVVTKDEIFAEVWEENPEKATDWALDALIYRLRRHPFIQSQGYIIESYKKQGYSLIS